MGFRVKVLAVVVATGLLAAGHTLLEPAQPTLATPSLGSDCLNCHAGIPATKDNLKTAKPPEEVKATNVQQAPAGQPAPSASSGLRDVVVTAYFLNVRANSSSTAKIIGVIKKGDVLTVLEDKYGWCKVKHGAGTGWVYGQYVKPAPAAEPGNAATSGTLSPPAPSFPKPAPVALPSINDQARNSPLGSRHWNMFRNTYNNPADPEQTHCMSCHSAVVIVNDPKAAITDFLKAGQQYCYDELDNPAPGQSPFLYKTATEDGKYVANDFEGITCRVCHELGKDGLTLRRPDNTCTLCHGRTFNWSRGSGSHVEQDFFAGHGETYWDPSVHYTLGMQCQSCHTMKAVKHDYAPAKPADVVKDGQCLPCHKSAGELEHMIETTQAKVADSLEEINARVKAARELITTGKVLDPKGLVAKAGARSTFITKDMSNGVHNPQFAAKLITEANQFLDEFDKAAGKASATPALSLGGLSVFSQAQTSKLGNMHWDMLEDTVFNPADPEQDGCLKCHSAVSILDDPKAKVADFLQTGQQYCSEELRDPAPGQDPFVYTKVTTDGKYLKNRLEGITCRVCHTFNQNQGDIGMRRSEEQTCGLCHGRTYNWTTGSGSHVELAFLKGQGSKEKGIPDLPSPKAAMGFSCQDCHFMDSTKHDFAPATPAQVAASGKCNSCHTAASVEKQIKAVGEEVAGAVKKLKPRLATAKDYVSKHPDNAAAKELYTQANAGVNFIVKDYSNGVHNPPFARTLLSRSDQLLTQFEAAYK